MLNGNDLLVAIKTASLEVSESSKPTAVVLGTVTSVNPLKITVEQKMTLSMAQLILAREVTDYNVDMTVDHWTELMSGGSGESAFELHKHRYLGRKTFLVHKSLTLGEEVIMLRVQGGQKFVVMDRLGK